MNEPLLDTDSAALAEVAKAAAIAGGDELMAWRGRFEARQKGPRDFVTDADLASQRAVHAVIADRCPSHQFVGEESQEPEVAVDHARPCWVVDPLDGTTNYLHDFPAFSVSVAVVVDGWPLAGAIYDPLREEMFWAAAGGGAWLGEAPIKTGSANELASALVGVSLPAGVGSDAPDLRDFIRLAPRCRAVRRIGSAALNLAYVACGRLNAFLAREIRPWDIAAGALLVSEAGGQITDGAGQRLNVWKPPCLATNGAELQREMLSELF